MSGQKTNSTRTTRASGKRAAGGLDALAFHLSEVLCLTRGGSLVSVDFYNAVGEAVNDHIIGGAVGWTDSREFLRLALRLAAEAREGDTAGA